MSGDDRLGRFASAAIANLRETEANIARGDFNAVVRLLADRKRPVHVRGGRFTDPIAEYLVAHLRVFRPKVRRITGERMSWLDQLLDIGKRDVFVLFDIRRYSEDLADARRPGIPSRRDHDSLHGSVAVADLEGGEACSPGPCRRALGLGFLGRAPPPRRGAAFGDHRGDRRARPRAADRPRKHALKLRPLDRFRIATGYGIAGEVTPHASAVDRR